MSKLFNDHPVEAIVGFFAAATKTIYDIVHSGGLANIHFLLHTNGAPTIEYLGTFIVKAFEACLFGLIGSAAAVIGKHYGTKFKNKFLK